MLIDTKILEELNKEFRDGGFSERRKERDSKKIVRTFYVSEELIRECIYQLEEIRSNLGKYFDRFRKRYSFQIEFWEDEEANIIISDLKAKELENG
mgnify:CR=1 FL=1